MLDTYVTPIWRRHYTSEMINKKRSIYRIYLGAALLSLTNITPRVTGIKYISEAIRAVRQAYQPHRGMTAKELIAELRSLGVMEHIFGRNTHYQLVHRSQDLLRLLFVEKAVEEADIDSIWHVCTTQGQQIKLEIYRIILEVLRASYNCMTDQTKQHFVRKFASMEPNQLIEKDIEIVTELGKRGGVTFRQPDQFVQDAAAFLWSVAVLEREYALPLSKLARKKFCEQVHCWDDSLKEGYIAQCLDNISNGRLPLQNLKIAVKLIERMTQGAYGATRRTRQDFAHDLIETQEVDELLIRDLESYMAFANGLVAKGELRDDNRHSLELPGQHPFTHLKNIKSRLKRLRSLLMFARAKLQPSQIERIWDTAVEKSALRESDQSLFFNWLKTLLSKESRLLLSEDLLVELFRVKIVPCDLALLRSLRVNGLECVIRLFAHVNEQQGHLVDLDPASGFDSSWSQPGTGYSGAGAQNSNPYSADNDSSQSRSRYARFRVSVNPCDLEGVGLLWTVLANSDSGNATLLLMVQRTLVNIYTNLTPDLARHAQAINDSFVAECLSCLRALADPACGKSEKERRETLKCVAQMLSSFFEFTELHGLGGMRLHRQLEEAPFLTKVLIDVSLPVRAGVDAKFLEISAPSNMTLWQLKELVAKYTNASPLCIQLKRTDSKKPELLAMKHSKLLSDLKLADGETLTASRAPPPELPRVPTVDRLGRPTPELRAIVSAWFQTYSVELDRDGIVEIANEGPEETRYTDEQVARLPERVRVMTRDTCRLFAEAVTATAHAPGDHRVRGLFERYSRALGNGQLLTEPELQAMYQDQANTKEEVVRQNLSNQGIGPDLQPRVDWNSLTFETDIRLVRDASSLPRAKLSKERSLFD